MSLINYLLRALKPSIFCEDSALSLFFKFSNILEDVCSLEVSSDRTKNYDIIVTTKFQWDLYNLLNRDGFYFCTEGFDGVKGGNFEYIYYGLFCIVKKGGMLGWMLDLKEHDPIYLRNFSDSFNITPYRPPFEIINHPQVIYGLCRELKVSSYLELGVRDCPVPALIKSIVPNITGVDVTPVPNFPGSFYCGTTDAYFEMCRQKGRDIQFDMIFIDACHDYEQAKTDFDNSRKYIKNGGTIILHDTYPVTEYMTQPQWCSDSYKTVEYIRKLGLRVINLPISPGLCIVQPS